MTKIKVWNTDYHRSLWGMIREWTKLTIPGFSVEIIQPNHKLMHEWHKLTSCNHEYNFWCRTVIEINNKLIYMDGSDSYIISAEATKLPFDLIIKSQYAPNIVRSNYKAVPFIFFLDFYDMNIINKARKIRKEIVKSRNFKTSMFWAGKLRTNPRFRVVLRQYIKNTKLGATPHCSFEDYYQHIAETQVGVASKGNGDFCHREFEYMSVGTPFFRKTLNSQTYNPLMPNVHYYSIGGDEVGIDKTMQHYIEYFEPDGHMKDFTNEEWDQYIEISNNGLQWYEDNITPMSSLNLFVRIISENGIL